jgi:TolB protein
MRDDDRYSVNDSRDATIAQLLAHLQLLRRSVPVNYQLKEELKEKLLQRMKEMERHKQHSQLAQNLRKRRIAWWLSGGTVAIALAAVFAVWSSTDVKVRESSLLSLSGPMAVEQVDINANGSYLAYVAKDEKIHAMPLTDKAKEEMFGLPSIKGRYHALAWAHNNRQLAVVEKLDASTRLWVVDVPRDGAQNSSRLIKEESNVEYRSPDWSPDNERIAYTKIIGGVEEIWVSSTLSLREQKLTEGSQPEWSPDGKLLAFVKQGSVSLMDLESGKVTPLGAGAWPSWNSAQTLTYTTPDGRLAEVRLDVQPPETKLMSIAKLSDDKLVRATWATDQKHLLLSQQSERENVIVISLATR